MATRIFKTAARGNPVKDPCVVCGESTAKGSGKFVNRSPMDNGYMCAECESGHDAEMARHAKFHVAAARARGNPKSHAVKSGKWAGVFVFHPSMMDVAMPQHVQAVPGQRVRVAHAPSTPKPGTMGQVNIEDADTAEWLGMCAVQSLSREGAQSARRNPARKNPARENGTQCIPLDPGERASSECDGCSESTGKNAVCVVVRDGEEMERLCAECAGIDEPAPARRNPRPVQHNARVECPAPGCARKEALTWRGQCESCGEIHDLTEKSTCAYCTQTIMAEAHEAGLHKARKNPNLKLEVFLYDSGMGSVGHVSWWVSCGDAEVSLWQAGNKLPFGPTTPHALLEKAARRCAAEAWGPRSRKGWFTAQELAAADVSIRAA